MTVTNTFTFSNSKLYYGKFKVSAAANQEAGAYIQRDSFYEHGCYTIENQHPTLQGVQRAHLAHVITGGSCVQVYEWGPTELITDEDVDGLLQTISNTGATSERLENELRISYAYTGADEPWQNWQNNWGLKTSVSRLEAGADGLSFFCIVHIEDDIESWTRHIGDIGAGQTFSFERPICGECYIIFGQPVTVNGTEVEPYVVKRIASEQISIVNSTEEPCRMLRFYK